MSRDLRQFKKEAEGTEEPGGQDLQRPAQAHSECGLCSWRAQQGPGPVTWGFSNTAAQVELL